ncbi:MAG: LysM peptidoglycan-binding domain-containing M23 family metallopeptidase [Spirochaetales bacterium]|nr:LysM peptidoglycan-binding domain-containing M23 family metallopeptidase [Spirochaetales bacterium]
MARSRNYDDLSDNNVSSSRGSSSKILLAVIMLSILICAIAVLVWVKILESQNVKSSKTATATTTATTPVTETKTVVSEPLKEPVVETAVEEPVEKTEPELDLSIDSGLSALSASANTPEVDYLNSSVFASQTDDGYSDVVEQGIEMKKPLIAQNLSISQQSSFSKDIVKYQEYKIKEGDSLISIADSFGLSVQTIVSVNQIKSTMDIWIGSDLLIPDRDGTLYIVKEGDTLLSITQKYELGISAKALGDVNGLTDDSLEPGQKLFIPSETLETTETTVVENDVTFIRPAQGNTIGMYNRKVANPISNDSLQLDGILIQAPAGTPVVAAESGTVVDKGFNDNGSGFLKIMHASGYTTFYNYLGFILVDTADTVEKGQPIATLADGTSNYNPPVLFFRIEQGGVAFDPEQFF